MWPWEHLAVGYLLYSLAARLRDSGGPTGRGTLAVAVGTQFPDLLDKPLAWGLGVFDSGVALGHSLLFALPVSAAALVLSRRRGHGPLAAAFVIGYLSHLPLDLAYPFLLGRPVSVTALLWPLDGTQGGGATGLFTRTGALLDVFTQFLATPRGRAYLLGEALLLGTAIAVWMADGRPGLLRGKS